jgi:hypothetical protein
MPTIDYARMQRRFPRQKAALTRAVKIADREARQTAVLKCAKDAVAEWNAIGAWPDDWARWQRALDDAYPFCQAPSMQDYAF